MRLVDADAIVEVMKKCAENPENAQALLCYRYAQRILEEAPTVEPSPPWHRVEEPPKKDGHYLTFYANGYFKANWWSNNWGWMYDADAVRYWMPLPEPPKEDA